MSEISFCKKKSSISLPVLQIPGTCFSVFKMRWFNCGRTLKHWGRSLCRKSSNQTQVIWSACDDVACPAVKAGNWWWWCQEQLAKQVDDHSCYCGRTLKHWERSLCTKSSSEVQVVYIWWSSMPSCKSRRLVKMVAGTVGKAGGWQQPLPGPIPSAWCCILR